MLLRSFCAVGLICGLIPVANAADTPWSAAKCGVEPAPPSLHVATVAQYNETVDHVSSYEKQARAYNACVASAANRAETSVSEEARERIAHIHETSSSVQARIATTFKKLSASLAVAGKRFGSH